MPDYFSSPQIYALIRKYSLHIKNEKKSPDIATEAFLLQLNLTNSCVRVSLILAILRCLNSKHFLSLVSNSDFLVNRLEN